jgi:hypothetical protein
MEYINGECKVTENRKLNENRTTVLDRKQALRRQTGGCS